MKKLFSITLITCSSLLLISTACSQTQTTNLDRSTFAAEKVSTESIQQTALAITVKVTVGSYSGSGSSNSGSGILIARSGNIYTVVTNAHVVGKDSVPYIKTVDGKTHSAEIKKTAPRTRSASKTSGSLRDRSNDLDLVLLQFEAEEQYTVAPLESDRSVKLGQTVFIAGFADGEDELTFNSGKIEQISQKPLVGGYQIGFTNKTKQGMSGGALLSDRGKVIGILGLSAAAILDNAYVYTDGSRPDAQMLAKLRKNSFAVPVTSLTAQQDLSFLATANSSQASQDRGIVGQVDSIAQQITVKINSENNGNGSGVIVAQQGDTYYVLTAGHVVTNEDNYTLVAPDGKSYPIKNSNIQTFEGIDLALFRFTSGENYATATLADYLDRPEYGKTRFDQWIFISGFPGNQKERTLSAGRFTEIGDWTAEMTKDSFSLANGNGLLYTNLSLPGMSGGAVLDSQGQLIGINTGAENEYVETTTGQYEEVALGYSLGVPIKNFLSLAKAANLPSTALKQENSIPLELTNLESYSLKEQLFKFKTPGKNATETDWLNYGNQLWRAGEDDKAVEAFNRAIAINPKEYRAYYGKGLASFLDEQQKINAFRQATKLAPNFYAAWQQLAFELTFGGESQDRTKLLESLAAYNRAIQLEPKIFTNYIRRGSVLKNLQRYDEAIASYSQSLKLQPTAHAYVLIQESIGMAYIELEDYQSAIAILSQAIKKDPQAAELYGNRGNAYKNIKNYQAALADYNSALEIYESWAGYLNRSLLYYELNNVQQGDRDFAKGLELLKQGLTLNDEPKLQNLVTVFKKAEKPEAAQKIQKLISYVKASKYYNRGGELLEQKNYQEAIKFFTKAINIDPQFHRPYSSRAVTYYVLEKHQLALRDLERAIAINPKYTEAYMYRSVVYRELKDYQKALTDSNKAIALNSKFAKAYLIRGEIYYLLNQAKKAKQNWQKSAELYAESGSEQETNLEAVIEQLQQELQKDRQENDWESHNRIKEALKQFQIVYYLKKGVESTLFSSDSGLANKQKAIDFYTKVIELEPRHARAYLRRAQNYRELKDYQKAIADFKQAIAINRELYAYLDLAELYQNELKDYQSALSIYNQAITAYPDSDIYNRRAYLYEELKEYQKAIDDYTKSIENVPDNSDFYVNRGNVYLKLERYQSAIADYTKAIEIYPEYERPYKQRGIAYYALQDYPSAINDLNKAIDLCHKGFSTNICIGKLHLNRGIVYNSNRQYREALNDFTKVIASEPKNADAYSWRGVTYLNSKEYQKAIVDLDRAISINPQLTDAYFNRGIAYYSGTNYQAALDDLTKVVTSEPKNADAYLWRGNVYGKLKSYQKAIADLDRAISINSQLANAYLNRGTVYYLLKEDQKAKQDWQTAAQLYKQQGDLQSTLQEIQKQSQSYQQQGKTEDYQRTIQVIELFKQFQ